VARQEGAAIFSMLASFHVDEPGNDYQHAPHGDAPDPETLGGGPIRGHNQMFDLRSIVARPVGIPGMSHRFWARTRGPLPDDRLLHACALTYLSDMSTGFAKLELDGLPRGGPSLDHAVWFHRPARLDDWVLVEFEPITSAGSRGYYTGAVYDRDGALVATIAQEQVYRARTPG
jgi:acyl-CoA thioesterase-2